ncbi:carboxypeptidase-like regulatory domain-containing protein [Streptomyces sp. NPDC051940]|uniref:MSCRAMM family protein n=1 Tax=Streptomyces sp. NPDC051940 TaxID=3155675 RepID=UPI0034346D26
MAADNRENALVVHVFAYPTTDGGQGPHDDGVTPLDEVSVQVFRGSYQPAALERTGRTSGDGTVAFSGLDAAADYRISVAAPAGFRNASRDALFFEGQPRAWDPRRKRIRVRKGGEVVVHVGLVPEPVSVRGRISLPGGTKAPGVRVEARSVEGELLEASDTGKKGGFTLSRIHRPGLIEVRPAALVEIGGRRYVPAAGKTNLMVRVRPGGTAAGVDIPYKVAGAEIRIGARIVHKADGRTADDPFDGVTFQLFKDGRSTPLHEVRTHSQTPGTFRDLAPGEYRIVALPPESTNGWRLQRTRPVVNEVLLQVTEGERIDLGGIFEFRPALGSLRGMVVADRDGAPMGGVDLLLSSQRPAPDPVQRTRTRPDGSFEFTGLAPGPYRVELEQQVVTVEGRRWEQKGQDGQSEGGWLREVAARQTETVPAFRLVEEEHLISGRVLRPDGSPAAFVTVQIFDSGSVTGRPRDNVLTDEHGEYRYRADSSGTYYVRVLERNGLAPQVTPVSVHSETRVPDLFTDTRPFVPGPSGADGRTGGNGSGGFPSPPPPPAPESDLGDFPFLTEEVRSADGGRADGAGPGAAGGVGRIVERELREVLGWRPRAGDPKGFRAALDQAFTVAEVAGHTEVTWRPRSYAVEIQADLGAVTGAQASLYNRAQHTLEKVLPLLDGLTPLRTDADDENVAAARAVLRTQLTELVGELGMEGGPRVARVDQFLVFLLGDRATAQTAAKARPVPPPGFGGLRDPDTAGGSLGLLRDRLGLQRRRINTVDEEQNFTNFLILLDQIVGLAESWQSQRDFFDRSKDAEPFLGTQLVLLSRDLEVIAESVHETEFAMDSVFLGAAERQTLELRFTSVQEAPMFVSELLDWVERFAVEEGRQLIDEGGRQGVAVAFRPVLVKLRDLVRAAQVTPAGDQDPLRMPDAYRRRRVQRALAELALQLQGAAERVGRITAPVEDPDRGPATRGNAQGG